MYRNALALVERRKLHRSKRFGLKRDGRLGVEDLRKLRRELDLGDLEYLWWKDEAARLDEDVDGPGIAPDRRPIGLVRRRRIVPGKNRPHQDERIGEAELVGRV